MTRAHTPPYSRPVESRRATVLTRIGFQLAQIGPLETPPEASTPSAQLPAIRLHRPSAWPLHRQRPPDRPDQFLLRKRLGDDAQRVPCVRHPVLGKIAAGEQHAGLGIDIQQPLEHDVSRQPRHVEIENRQVDPLLLLAVNGNRLPAILGQQHAVTLPFENPPTDVAHQRIAVGQ